MDTPEVVVLGSGIAGLVAAHELAERGLRVTVLEAGEVLGGRTSTFVDARGRTVDTGLHVVADHYANLIEVLGRLGATRKLRWVEEHMYLEASRPPMRWYFSPRRPPFHLVRPFTQMPMSAAARLRLALTGAMMAAYEQADLAELDDERYIDWHRRNRLGDGFVLELAEAAADAATFLPVTAASARPVLSWIKYLMRHRSAGHVGLFQGTLEECLVRPLREAIERRGGVIRTRSAVLGMVSDGRRILALDVAETAPGVRVCNGADGAIPILDGSLRRVRSDHVISALPVQALRRVLSAELAKAAGLTQALTLTTTPAMSLIVWFDRRIGPTPEGAPLVTGCAMRDFVDLSSLGRVPEDAPGSVYQFVVTRASERMDHTDEQVVADCVADLKKVWPGAREARVVDYALERIGAAMFAAVPGAHRRRPTVSTRLDNLFLAGDWIRHDLNASMEGAALAGRLAAGALLQRMGRGTVPVRELADPTAIPVFRELRRRLAPRPRAEA